MASLFRSYVFSHRIWNPNLLPGPMIAVYELSESSRIVVPDSGPADGLCR
jgi:hypothetical protein